MTEIATVRAYQPPTPGSPQDWRTSLGQIIIEIATKDGLAGIGVGGGGLAGVHIVETVLREVLIGRAAEDVESIHEELCEHTRFYGRKGVVVMAISGVDLALWDLRGKREQLPIARLLNSSIDLGKPLPTYTTVFGDQETRQAMHAGHGALKLHVERFGDRPAVDTVRELVENARELLGAETPLMLDAFARWDLETTLQIANAVAPLGVAWLEEPLPPEDYRGYEQLRAESPVPIAAGEHEYLREGFAELIEQSLVDVVQPDVNWCGGLTTLIEVYRMANRAGLRVCPHRGSEPFALPAIAALDKLPLAESPRHWFNVFPEAPSIHKGTIVPSSGHGFGVSFRLPQS